MSALWDRIAVWVVPDYPFFRLDHSWFVIAPGSIIGVEGFVYFVSSRP